MAVYHAQDDARWSKPYIDADERRERILEGGKSDDPKTIIPYRYLHGGFEGTGVKFSICLPGTEEYPFEGRFFQYLSPAPGPEEEVVSLDKTGEDDKIAFAITHGAGFIESNMGAQPCGSPIMDQTIAWKASAAVAEYARDIAVKLAGERKNATCPDPVVGKTDHADVQKSLHARPDGRPYVYVYGGSGGGYKTMACIENTDAFDGGVPYVIGSPVSLPNTITMHAQGQRALRHVFGKITDALEPGGSGNMYEGLTEEEADMLHELTRMGFPPRTWFMEANGIFNDGSLKILIPLIRSMDPSYLTDFWTVPGYLGSDPSSQPSRDRLQMKGIVKSVHMPANWNLQDGPKGQNGVDDAWRKGLREFKDAWIELETMDDNEQSVMEVLPDDKQAELPELDGKSKEENPGSLYTDGGDIFFRTGAAAGRSLPLGAIDGNRLMIGVTFGMDSLKEIFDELRPGDEVFLDNSDYIAAQSYYRYQNPRSEFHQWDQFRDAEGNRIIPAREKVISYYLNGTGTQQSGNIQCKAIVIEALMDESSCPWCADWYRGKVKEAKGNEDDFRVYYMDRCLHGDVSTMESDQVINYMGALRQTLLDLSSWVETGKQPLPSSVYSYVDGQIIPAKDPKDRCGIQPSVKLLVNRAESLPEDVGEDSIHIRAGEKVRFTAKVTIPEGAGELTAADFDFSDSRIYPDPRAFGTAGVLVNGCGIAEHIYDKPGTYFASVRVKIQRNGDKEDLFTQVKNLARARVVVE